MKTAIVFGANGYLGRHIAYFLKEQNIEFVPVGLAPLSKDNYPNYIQIDITDKEKLQQLDFNVDYVFAFAGLTGTGNSKEEIEKFTKVNELGLSNIIECCEGVDRLRVIFPSTRLVYKGVKNTPLIEGAEKESKTIYAKNKLACEKMLRASNVDYTIFRICVPYGNLLDQVYSYGTIGFFINRAVKGENITIYGDGNLNRTFTHISDIVKTILKSINIDSTLNDVYNIGSNDALSLLEIANLVAHKYSVKVDFIDWPPEQLKIESGDTIFDDNKLQKKIDLSYDYSFKKWVEKIA